MLGLPGRFANAVMRFCGEEFTVRWTGITVARATFVGFMNLFPRVLTGLIARLSNYKVTGIRQLSVALDVVTCDALEFGFPLKPFARGGNRCTRKSEPNP